MPQLNGSDLFDRFVGKSGADVDAVIGMSADELSAAIWELDQDCNAGGTMMSPEEAREAAAVLKEYVLNS